MGWNRTLQNALLLTLATVIAHTAWAGSDTDSLHHYQITDGGSPAGIHHRRDYSYAEAATHYPGYIYTFPSADITQELVNSIYNAENSSNLPKGCTVTTHKDLAESDTSDAMSFRKALAKARKGECTYGSEVAWVCGQYFYDAVHGHEDGVTLQGCTSSIPLAASGGILQVVSIPVTIQEIALKSPLIVPPGVVIIGGTPQQAGALSFDYKSASEQDQKKCNPNGRFTDLKQCLPLTVRAGMTVITIDPSVAPKNFQATDAHGVTTRALLYVEAGETTQSGPVHIAGITLKDAPFTALESSGHHGVFEWLKIIQSADKKQSVQGSKRNLKDQSKWTKDNSPLMPCADPKVSALQCMQYFVCATADGEEYLCKDHPEYQGTLVALGDGAYTGWTPGIVLRGADNIVQRVFFDRPGDLVRTVAAAEDAPLPGNYVSRLSTSPHVSGIPYWSDLHTPTLIRAARIAGNSSICEDDPNYSGCAKWSPTKGWGPSITLEYNVGPIARDFEIEVYVQSGDKIRRLTIGGYHYGGITAASNSAASVSSRTVDITIDLKKEKIGLNDRIVLAVHEFAALPATTEKATNWVRSSSVPYTRMSEPVTLAELDVDGDGLNQYCEIMNGWSDNQINTTLTRETQKKSANSTFYTKERLNPETCTWIAFEAGGTVTVPVAPTRTPPAAAGDRTNGRADPTERRSNARGRIDRGPAQEIMSEQSQDDPSARGGGGGGAATETGGGEFANPFEEGAGGGGAGEGGPEDNEPVTCKDGLIVAGTDAECADAGAGNGGSGDGNENEGDPVVDPDEAPCGRGLVLIGTACAVSPCGAGTVWNTQTAACDSINPKKTTPATETISGGCSLLLE